MKTFIHLLILQLLLTAIGSADDYAVITNKKIDSLEALQIKAIFLKKLETVNNIKMVPINLEPMDPLRINFENNFLHMNFKSLNAYWIKQHYLGHRPPISIKSQQSAIAMVKELDGGIAYVNTKYIDDDVNVVHRWSDNDEYAIIANKKIKNLKLSQIKAIFLKKLVMINDTPVVPINLEPMNPLRIQFENKFLHMNPQALNNYWTQEHYLGHRPPISIKSQQSAIAMVKELDGGIAYVNTKYIDNSVQIIYQWDKDTDD